jgi:hypothetical protein
LARRLSALQQTSRLFELLLGRCQLALAQVLCGFAQMSRQDRSALLNAARQLVELIRRALRG